MSHTRQMLRGKAALDTTELEQESSAAGRSRLALIRGHRECFLTLREVAEAVGVSKATVCRWEQAMNTKEDELSRLEALRTLALAAQGFLLRARLALHLSTSVQAVTYARQAEAFSSMAENLALQVTAPGLLAVMYHYSHHYKRALLVTEQALQLLEEQNRLDHQKEASVARSASAPVSPLVTSSC